MAAIEPGPLAHNAQASIATHVENCLKAFSTLCVGLQSSNRANSYQIHLSDVKDEFGRFRIWSGNIGAHRTGRSSLSYRLRDASHLKSRVIELLTDLKEALWGAYGIIHGEKVPWEELSNSNSDSTISGGDPASEESTNESLQATSELQQLMADVVEVITCLFRLSMAIRNPAPHNQFMESSQIDTSYFEEFDIGHVQAKFPNAEEYLATRLGKAISRRRQYLKYRDEHHKKLAQGIEDVTCAPKPFIKPIGMEAAPTEINPESTVASSIPSAMKAQAHIDLDEDVYPEDGFSQTSYATSANESTKLRAPPVPKGAQDGQPFECPLCFMIISIRSSHSWKKHVYQDLRPYICTFEDCKAPDHLFDTRHQWFDHEMQTHRRWWECVEGCNKPFHSKASFQAHLERAHPALSGGAHLPVLMHMCERKASMNTPADCSLCHQPLPSLTQLRRHMGQHYEQLALFAIPSNLEEVEENDSKVESDKEAEKGSIGSARTESEFDEDETTSNGEINPNGQTERFTELTSVLAKASGIYEMNRSSLTPSDLIYAKRILALSMFLPGHLLKELLKIHPSPPPQ
ncbi:hypothetical protein AOQ84DRAFT_383049 [Glonium stellatum]|uniref:C2H2-type domain-containing protein n=1 Tax=Glonium stellatum TaxID=574774 RepID=A0A8E2EP69_9PEZI|nr:hypothetical protein AOQ84DRAFT_383049 [Glonium stellatum]